MESLTLFSVKTENNTGCHVSRCIRELLGDPAKHQRLLVFCQHGLQEFQVHKRSTVHGKRTRNRQNLKVERFWLDTRGKFYNDNSKKQKELPRELMLSPSQEVSKTTLDKALRNLIWPHIDLLSSLSGWRELRSQGCTFLTCGTEL